MKEGQQGNNSVTRESALQVKVPSSSHWQTGVSGDYIGVDIGGSKIAGALIRFEADGGYHVLDAKRVKARSGNRHVVEDVTRLVLSLLCIKSDIAAKGSGNGSEDDSVASLIKGIGLCIPGRVDSREGIVENVANLGIRRLALGEEIRKATGLPVHVENDVNAAALGAYTLFDHFDEHLSKSQSKGDVAAFLNLGTGLAAGVLRDGVPDGGFNGVVGEIGHLPVERHRWPCGCGQNGCLETAAGGNGIKRQWPYADPPMPDIIANAHDEASQLHKEACRTLDTIISAIADAIDIIALTIDPFVIIIGGGTAKTGTPLLTEVQTELKRRASQSSFVASLHLDERVVLVDASEPIGSIGAASAMVKSVS